MSERTNIAWCDSTVNFWSGCTKVSDGCKNCYAEARDKRQMIEKKSHWGKGAPRLKGKGAVKTALTLNRKPWICDDCGFAATVEKQEHNQPDGERCWHNPESWHRRRIFSLSLGDWLDDEVPIEWLAEMLDTLRQCDQVTWILCTKRPENFQSRFDAAIEACKMSGDYRLGLWLCEWALENLPPDNVILLTSVENQQQERRIVDLMNIPAACRGLSVEPMLGPILFRLPWFSIPIGDGPEKTEGINWVIFGGESGDKARPCNVGWIREGVKQCQAAGVPVFVKQLGAYVLCDNANDYDWPDEMSLIGEGEGFAACRALLSDKKGGAMHEWPEEFRIQQHPVL